MTTTISLPAAKPVRDLLADLLDREVDISPSPPLVPGVKELAATAVYVDDHLRTAAVVAFDLRLAAYAGAAVGLLPRGSAEGVHRGPGPLPGHGEEPR